MRCLGEIIVGEMSVGYKSVGEIYAYELHLNKIM
jgi:hypothetical protein